MTNETEYQRLRAWAMRELADGLNWKYGEHYRAAMLPPSGYTDDAWVHFEDLTDPVDMGWYVFRDPDKPADMHVDQLLLEHGEIVGKGCCGLEFYSECQPCRFPDDVLALIARMEGGHRSC
jgi:hypothetical protein